MMLVVTAVTNLVINGVERTALDFDEDIVGSLEGRKWNIDKLEYVGITGSVKSDSVHGCRNRRHADTLIGYEDEGDEGPNPDCLKWLSSWLQLSKLSKLGKTIFQERFDALSGLQPRNASEQGGQG